LSVLKGSLYYLAKLKGSKIAVAFMENCEMKSLKEILALYSNYFPVVPKKFKQIEKNKNYSVYVVDPNESYYKEWQTIYFLMGNKTILIAQPNPLS
jgi:hypothetical protein